MLKQYLITITTKKETTQHYFIGDTDENRFYEAKTDNPLSWDEAAAAISQYRTTKYKTPTAKTPDAGKLTITLTQSYLQDHNAVEVPFAKIGNPPGCIV